ncbi:MBL fold metallo-hydrolase [Trinickia dinghuensis]|uniref:MBL fold metallo-hydrolase n=1 Tax=Trinickia dinghuensis TaxID=2291023 RepID=A0A3D8K213_9BURK|nr:MBL fold metallo-hydrolase [Trinickia dinghuensis]RDU99483.1 MBL fold metallo-hydrolase [Trinickia dinghuensis]
MMIEGHFDSRTSTVSYLLCDSRTRECAIVDSVLDYDAKSGRTWTESADKLVARVNELGAKVRWLLETHVHADHLSAAQYLREKIGGSIAIGAGVVQVQEIFGPVFNLTSDSTCDGREFDRLLDDNDTLQLGTLEIKAVHTPGHTPACITYVVTDGPDTAAFVGDTLFAPDYGTSRCDFPGGNAGALYRSIEKILGLPKDTKLFTCHDYQPGGRSVEFMSTVAQQREENIHVREGIDESTFVAMRTARDKTLDMPALLLPSVQVNMRAGRMPDAESNGVRYIKIPLNGI